MGSPRKVEMVLSYQNYIENPPATPKQLYGNACASDRITIDSWLKTWCENVKACHAKFKSFKDHSVGKLFNINKHKPAFVIGSGPSLGYNGAKIKDRDGILAISALHNFHFFEDRDVDIDYYVSLDAGKVVLEEVSEGGSKTEQEYWDRTKNKKLIAFIGSPIELFNKWQGEVYLFNAPVPDQKYIQTVTECEPYHMFVSNGGNVLGGCLYIAKAIFGSNPVAFMGADFSFGYDQGNGIKFHSWNSKYDANMGTVMRGVDVYGNKVLTWNSYFGFKNFTEYVTLTVPGLYINCTEGGMLGAYPEGNLMSIKQMPVDDFLMMYNMNEGIKDACLNPEVFTNKILY